MKAVGEANGQPWWGNPMVEAALVAGILGAAAFFRLYALDRLPPGLDLDEARGGIEAARVVAGEHPLLFTTFDPREALFHYSLAPSIALLGHTILALRLPAVAWGLLAVGLTYLAGRWWFGRGVAAVASLGLALSLWHVIGSRWSIHSITVPSLVLLMLLSLWRAFERRSVGAFALAGALAALGWWAYVGARILPLLLVLIVAGQWLLARESIRHNGRGLVAAAGGMVVVLLPLAIYYVRFPEFFLWRVQDVNVLGAPAPGMESTSIVQTTLRTLGMFFVAGDPGWRTNVNGQPVLPWWLAIFFCLGLLLACWRVRSTKIQNSKFKIQNSPARSLAPNAHMICPRVTEGFQETLFPYFWLLAWQVVLLIPAFVARPAPHYGRTIGTAPSTYLLLAIGLRGTINWLRAHRPAFGAAAAVGAAGLLCLLGAQTFNDYFNVYAAADPPQRDFEAGQVFDATFLNDHQIPPQAAVFFLGYASGTSVRFLAPQYVGSIWMEDFSQLVPITDQPVTTYVFAAPSLPSSTSDPALLQRYFPDARIVGQRNFPNGEQAARIFEVTASQLEAFQGPARPVNVAFRDEVLLESVSLPAAEVHVRPEEPVKLGISWRMLQNSRQNYAAFVHVVDGSAKLVTQDDHQGMATFGWKAGQRFLSLQTFALPKDSKPGRYTVLAGIDQRSRDVQPSRSLGALAPPIPFLTLIVDR